MDECLTMGEKTIDRKSIDRIFQKSETRKHRQQRVLLQKSEDEWLMISKNFENCLSVAKRFILDKRDVCTGKEFGSGKGEERGERRRYWRASSNSVGNVTGGLISRQAKVRVERQCKFPTIAKAPAATAVKLLERVLRRGAERCGAARRGGKASVR